MSLTTTPKLVAGSTKFSVTFKVIALSSDRLIGRFGFVSNGVEVFVGNVVTLRVGDTAQMDGLVDTLLSLFPNLDLT